MAQKFKSENYANLGGINTKVSPYVNGPEEFRDLKNVDFTEPGSLTQRPGTSFYLSATVVGRITGLYEFERLSGSSYLIATANTNAYVVTNFFSSFRSGLSDSKIFDFVTFVDRLFAANGSDFFKYDGQNSSFYSLPDGTSFNLAIGPSQVAGFTGLFEYAYGYLNDRGYYGPVGPALSASVASSSQVILTGFSVPTGYGISAIAIYRTTENGADLFRIGTIPATNATFVDSNLPVSSFIAPEFLNFTLIPRYIEIFNNSLFMAGFSTALSTFAFSEIGEPEAVKDTSFVEVRTNDGDKITALSAYSGELVIFKERSMHRLDGDNESNYFLREISNQYGCLSNRAIAVYNDTMLFLDSKGIVKYNGVSPEVVSTKIEQVFLGMNIEAARENAVAIHNRLRNEVWFGIPCNGATFNNCTVVWDYFVQAWTVFDGFEPSALTTATRQFDSSRAFFGSYTGSISYFDESFTGDNGQAFSLVIKSRFLADLGESTTKMFRRLYLDTDPTPLGVTSPLSINFFTDYGTSLQLGTTMYQSAFQSRIDFGLPGKALQLEVSKYNATLPRLVMNGFSFDYRELRRV